MSLKQQRGPLFLLSIVIYASSAAVAIGLLTFWALAEPNRDLARDPVGHVFSQAGDRWDALRAWYSDGPVDATPDWATMQLQVLNGDADRGRAAMVTYGCGSCHVIPRVAGAHGTVGPPLLNFADRAYIAGILPNRPGDLTRWLINPPLYAPDTAMPDLDVTETDATDMAAFLYTLGADG